MNQAIIDEPFIQINYSDYSRVVNILKTRCPKSGSNMACALGKSPDMKCFALHGDLTSNALIMMITNETDYGQSINISLPHNFEATQEVKQAFSSTSAISWKGAYIFVGIEREIATIIVEIGSFIYGNTVSLQPSYSYWLSPEKAANFENSPDEDEVVVTKLDSSKGVKFFMENWAYARSENGMKKLIEDQISVGAYHKGEVVAGAILSRNGLIGPLLTSKSNRRKGYGIKCMKLLLKEMVKNSLCPVSSVAQENSNSIALHEKLGMIVTHESAWIIHSLSN